MYINNELNKIKEMKNKIFKMKYLFFQVDNLSYY